MRRAIDKLNDLIRLDLDAIGAYEVAVDACERREIKSTLEAFRRDHERHVRDLSDLVTKMDGLPARHRDVKGIFILGFTKLASRGDYSALMAMRGNEELTNRMYESALKEDLGREARQVVERNYKDEQRHLAWIKDALGKRLWEEVPAEMRATGTDASSSASQSNGRRSSRRGRRSAGRRTTRRSRA